MATVQPSFRFVLTCSGRMEIMMKDLASRLVYWLIEQKKHITFAESCTGGLAAARLVDVPDASKVFDGSFVTYANETKIVLLGVSEETIREHGVVSEPVAGQMASGAAKKMGAQIGVGISGIAGPGGGTQTKPVGMVCFGVYHDGKVHTATALFGNIGRNAVRQAAVEYVYQMLLELLKIE